MIRSGAFRKMVMPMIALLSGIILFLSSFSMLLDNILYSSEFQKDAFNRLGIYQSVSELAERLSTEISLPQEQLEPIVKSLVTPDMISLNIKSLIEGMINYFKGNTEALPDLHLATSIQTNINSKQQGDIAAMSTSAAFAAEYTPSLAGLDKVNLSVLFMYWGEGRATDIMLVISLLQFILAYIPIFGFLLFITIFLFFIHKSTLMLRSWLQNTAVFYCITCLSVSCLIQLVLYLQLPHLLSLIDQLNPVTKNVLSSYIIYCLNTLTVQVILSGTILFGAVQAAVQLFERTIRYSIFDAYHLSFSKKTVFTSFRTMNKAHNEVSTRKTSIITLTLVVLTSISIFLSSNEIRRDFMDRNLGRAVSFLKGNSNHIKAVNARNDFIYLLEVKVLDSITKLPVQNLGIRVDKLGEMSIEPIRCPTDSGGSAAFLLGKGSFILVMDYFDILSNYDQPDSLPYEFELTIPGKSELTVMLDRQPAGLSSIAEANLQYIP